MKAGAHPTRLETILPLRKKFLEENFFQIRYNACHERGWSDSYLLTLDEQTAGYGSVKGFEEISDRDSIFEFYIFPEFREYTTDLFKALWTSSGALFIECQTNEKFLTRILYHYCVHPRTEAILFSDAGQVYLRPPGAVYRKRKEDDQIFEHHAEPIGDYVIEYSEQVVATGGFLLHYNFPFADLYMEVNRPFRRMGFGSFLIQELRKSCIHQGRVPAARTGYENIASRKTLFRGGLEIAGFVLKGVLPGTHLLKWKESQAG